MYRRHLVKTRSSFRPVSAFLCNDLNIGVSTGPVVDFRLHEHIQQQPGKKAPFRCSIRGISVGPRLNGPKKVSSAATRSNSTATLKNGCIPNGFYTVVRRFSSKEEPTPHRCQRGQARHVLRRAMLGFENHLNVFHENKHGLPENLAHGLAAFLNTTAVDRQFPPLQRTYTGQCNGSSPYEVPDRQRP